MRFVLLLWLCWSCACPLFAGQDVVERALRSGKDWEALAAYQGGVTGEFFVEAMNRIYAPGADWTPWMLVEESGVWLETGARLGEGRFFLRFAETEGSAAVPAPRELEGLRIVLDPGHIGGVWGPMEERSFAIADGPLFQEGDLTLAIAQRIAARLREMGVEVFLTRDSAEPVTPLRAEDFWEEARVRSGSEEEVPALAQRLFYRTAEIRERARRIEDWGGADLALAIHLNASGFADPEHPALHDTNDAHVLINGCYMESELASPEQRLELLLRLLKGYHLEEERLGRAMVDSIVERTSLPAYQYENGNASALDEGRYLWARNLLANRVFDCPVIFLEPWQANSRAVYQWAAAGDYEGERYFDGELRPSLPAVYCDFVLAALSKSYLAKR